MNIIRGLLIVCVVLYSGIIYAGEVVVSATRSPREIGDVPASVSVVARDEIERCPARNVDDLLRNVRGVSVLQPTGMGYGLPSQINIRGVPGQNSTLLLVDGMPLNEAGSGFVNINEVPLSDIRQIEVLRGAFSAIYGADAFGGVINIITRDPEDVPTSSASVEVGNEEYTRVSAQTSAGTKAKGFIVSVQRRTIDNYLARDSQQLEYWDWSTMQYIGYSKDVDNYDYEDENASVKVVMDVGDAAHLSLHGRYFGSELGYGKTSVAPYYPAEEESIMQNQSILAGAALAVEFSSRTTAEFRAFYRMQERRLWGIDFSHQQDDVPVYVRSYSETQNDDWRIDGIVRVRVSDGNVVSVGADYYKNNYDFDPLRNNATGSALPISIGKEDDIDNKGLYLQDEINLTEDLAAVVGVRMDSHTAFNETFSPKAGLVFNATDETVIRSSIGRAYRAPTAIELFQPDVIFGSTTFKSNPDLEPEYIIAADIGVVQKLGDNAVCHLDLFYNDMEDLIAKQVSGNSLVFQNVAEAWSAGAELGLEYDISDEVSVFGNYVYQQSKNETSGNDLENIPEHVASLSLRCSKEVGAALMQLTLTESYRGDRGYLDLANGYWRELDGYFRTDASFKVSWGKTIYVALHVQNATDEKYQEWQLINPAQGRLYSIELGADYW